MSAHALRLDDDRRSGTRVAMTVSVVVHALLILAIVLYKPVTGATEALTEITLLEPGESAGGDPAPAAAPAPAAEARKGAASSATRDEHFRRDRRDAELTPAPESDRATADVLEARLATLQHRAVEPIAGASGNLTGTSWNAAPAPAGNGGGGQAIALTRGGGGGGSAPGTALALTRGGGEGSRMALATLPGSGAGAEAAQEPGDAGARRTLAGVTLMGPIADRPVLHHVAPVYPDWAKHDGVEGVVTLYFIVRADGTIKENVLVQKTAGFGDFDDNARAALREWRFQPLDGGRTGEQWGTITFRFRLNSGG